MEDKNCACSSVIPLKNANNEKLFLALCTFELFDIEAKLWVMTYYALIETCDFEVCLQRYAEVCFVLFEKFHETFAVFGVQRVHLLAGRLLAAVDVEWRSDDSCDRSREWYWEATDASHHWKIPHCDLQTSHAATLRRIEILTGRFVHC